MPSVEIVTIGTEILLGDLIDTNAATIARTLSEIGIDVYAKHSVGDNAERLEAMLRGALDRADGVITTGGLGPTVDDLTKDAVVSALGIDGFELHEDSLRAIQERFAALGRTMSENNRRQALLPIGSTVLVNPHGTAPGFVAMRSDGKFVASMPGVPREMRPMLAERLVPWLRDRLSVRGGIFKRTLRTVGIPESELDVRIEDLFRSLENPKIAMLAHEGRVDVKIMAKAESAEDGARLIAPVEAQLRARIGAGIYGVDGETLESALVSRLVDRGLTLSTAESITGGAIADAIVRVPGASRAFRGGVVAYDNAVKISVLGVDPGLIAEHGAVSEEVAAAMARGARARLGSSISVATTGIAGPAGGSSEKPVGLVWFGLATDDGHVETRRVIFPGERSDVRGRAMNAGLNLLWRMLVR